MTDIRLGAKLLREDYSSLTNQYQRVVYSTEWQDVPGNGAYVAETSGLCCGGRGPTLAVLEVRERLGDGPAGVGRYRWVRRVDPARIAELPLAVRCCAPGFDLTTLRGANLYGANLYGADLCGANLRDANLGGVRLGTAAQGCAVRQAMMAS